MRQREKKDNGVPCFILVKVSSSTINIVELKQINKLGMWTSVLLKELLFRVG